VVFAVIGARRFRDWRERRARLARPGREEGAPIAVTSYQELEATWQRERCACGGRLEFQGESTVAGAQGALTVVLLRCERCEERDALYFDVSGVPS
jgi:hypothetical protein